MGSLPFVIDTAMEGSVLHSANYRRPNFPLFAYRPLKFLDSGVLTDSVFGCFKVVGEDIGRSSSISWRTKRLRAKEKGSGDVEDGDKSEDTFQATIEKSKKIAERRKLVSTIKNSIVDPQGQFSNEEEDITFSSLNIASTHDNATDEDDSNGNLSTTKEPEDLPPKKASFSANSPNALEKIPSDEGAKETEDLPIQKSSLYVNSRKQLTDTASEAVRAAELPSFLSSFSATSIIKDEQKEDFKESSLQEVTGEANDPANDNVKPPPLAGPNVMNVILVAAECAPWSKTVCDSHTNLQRVLLGGLGDVAGALPKALAWRGHRVMVVAPRYGNYAEPQDTGVGKRYRVAGQDILKRMVLLCKTAFEEYRCRQKLSYSQVPWHVPCGGACYGDGNLVFIANDWHTALLPVYLKAYYRDNGLMKYTRSGLVIHNTAHQPRITASRASRSDYGHYFLRL
ncbi:unnamed protein product [Ilex paraguariensis]|uniref:Starch synthase catalytic domain-containing protein n=1 Tax=Ilex paraguariensis TaxID=185542 RepID=A0ABC8T4B8_9AQUA